MKNKNKGRHPKEIRFLRQQPPRKGPQGKRKKKKKSQAFSENALELQNFHKQFEFQVVFTPLDLLDFLLQKQKEKKESVH